VDLEQLVLLEKLITYKLLLCFARSYTYKRLGSEKAGGIITREMSPVLFFHSVTLTTFVSLGATIVAAQFSIPYSIRTITITSATTNFTSFDSIRNLGMTWDIARANGNSLPFTFSTANSAIELMNGTIAVASNSVLDVVCMNSFYYYYGSCAYTLLTATNIGFTASIFSLRTSLPTGSYHFRVHSIVNNR